MKKDANEVDERNGMLSTQISKLESLKQEQASQFAQNEQQKRDELEPQIKE